MTEEKLKVLYDESVAAMQSGSSKKVIANIEQARIATANDVNAFYDFVSHVFLIDPTFFNEKCLKSYNKAIQRVLKPEQIMELEAHILQKHCFYRDEQMLAVSRGEIIIGNGKQVGRMYVTNIRLICVGVNKSRGTAFVTVSLLDKAINKSIHKSIVKGLQRRLGDAVGEEIPCIGAQYPMFGVDKLKPGKKRLVYRARVPSKNRTKKYMFMVKPYGTNTAEFIQILAGAIDEATKFFASV